MSTKIKSTLGGLAAVGIVTGLGAGSAQAFAAPTQDVSAPTAATADGKKTAWLVFDKNQSDPSKSELRLTVLRDGEAIKTLKFRAGSGMGSKDDCATQQGWLPNGRYDIKMHKNYQGSIVKGYALQLDDKKCEGGNTVRTELFIHTSTPWSDSRYKSYACIKLTPNHIEELYRSLAYHFPDVKDGGKLPFQLKVTD
ncbi:L,D-transpeptidase family protein [Dermacoccaceae bacterium W4C1]